MTAASSDAILERMMSLHPKVIDLTLDRVWRLLEAVGHPERALPPVIHVAGTNGKGSTIAMLRAGLEGSGQTVHVYTSPHLARFHERIRLASELIDEQDLTAVLDECLEANGPAPITYFEITTVAALLAFSRVPAHWTLLEVGLGGRLDATNVVDQPALTVITPVDLDHQRFLGETLAEIAAEKAGILKPGVPSIVGPQQSSALDVIKRRAEETGSPLLVHGQEWLVWEERERLIFQDDAGLLDLPLPALLGAHQIGNAGMAIGSLRQLRFGEASCENALRGAEWPARLQRLREGRLVVLAEPAELWLDGGHNPAAGQAIANAMRALPPRDLYLICGMLRTKDSAGFLRAFSDQARLVYTVDIKEESATLSAEETRDAAEAAGMTAVATDDVETAIREITQASPHSRILICGSLYLAGDVLRRDARTLPK
ncbi:MAG: folylpolyglutamate synthase/dihydrofolate synthase family protein [Pseudomonadota bacterium]